MWELWYEFMVVWAMDLWQRLTQVCHLKWSAIGLPSLSCSFFWNSEWYLLHKTNLYFTFLQQFWYDVYDPVDSHFLLRWVKTIFQQTKINLSYSYQPILSVPAPFSNKQLISSHLSVYVPMINCLFLFVILPTYNFLLGNCLPLFTLTYFHLSQSFLLYITINTFYFCLLGPFFRGNQWYLNRNQVPVY